MRLKIYHPVLFSVFLLIASCSKDAPRSMAEDLVGTYEGAWHSSSYSLNSGSFDDTHPGTCEVTHGSNRKSIIVHGIEFELERNQHTVTNGLHTITFSTGNPAYMHFETSQSSPGGSSQTQFSGNKVQ